MDVDAGGFQTASRKRKGGSTPSDDEAHDKRPNAPSRNPAASASSQEGNQNPTQRKLPHPSPRDWERIRQYFLNKKTRSCLENRSRMTGRGVPIRLETHEECRIVVKNLKAHKRAHPSLPNEGTGLRKGDLGGQPFPGPCRHMGNCRQAEKSAAVLQMPEVRTHITEL